MALFEQYLSEKDLRELSKYQYKAGIYTYLDEFLSANFWGPLVYVVPIWFAPNLLTLLGFLASMASAMLTLSYAPTFQEEIPPHVCFLIAFGLFLYQTLDALDGKQARRTGCSNSLGTLFDHGCDVLTTSFVVIVNMGVMGCGMTSLCTGILCITHLCQFICIWYEYYFNYFMAANNKFIGVTEIQFATIGTSLLTGVFGLRWAHTKVFGFKVFTIVSVAMFSYQVFNCTLYIVEGIYRLYMQQKGNERDPDLKLRRAITQLCIFVPFIIVEWFFLREAVVIGDMNIWVALTTVLLSNSTVCIRFILASCSNRTFHTIQWPILPFVFFTLVMVCGYNFGMDSLYMISKEHITTYGVMLMAYQLLYFLDFVVASINGMARVLEIDVFHIPYDTKKAD